MSQIKIVVATASSAEYLGRLANDLIRKADENPANEALQAEACRAIDAADAAQKAEATLVAEAEQRRQDDAAAKKAADEAATTQVAELRAKAFLAIKALEAEMVAKRRDDLTARGGDSVLQDAAEAKGLAFRLLAALKSGNDGSAASALRGLRQATISAGVLYHFGSVEARDSFLVWAQKEVRALCQRLDAKKASSRK